MIEPRVCNSYDIDGVIAMDGGLDGVYPGPNDVIITGRSTDEKPETEKLLEEKGLSDRPLFMNPIPFEEKTRQKSGIHKGMTLFHLEKVGVKVQVHFDDDPVQITEIKKFMPHLHCVLLDHDLVEKENVRRDADAEVRV